MVHRPRPRDGPRLGIAEEHRVAIPQDGLAAASRNGAESAEVQMKAEVVVVILTRGPMAYALHRS